jgi:hypothetical protein
MNNERIKEIKNYLKSRNWDKKSWILVDEANDILLDMNNEIDIPLYITENNNYDIVLAWLVNVLGDQNYLELEDQFCIDWDSQEIAERLDYFCCDYEVKKKAIEGLKL